MNLLTSEVMSLKKAIQYLSTVTITGESNELAMRSLLHFSEIPALKSILTSPAFLDAWMLLSDAKNEYIYPMTGSPIANFFHSINEPSSMDFKVLEMECRSAILDVFILLMKFSGQHKLLSETQLTQFNLLKIEFDNNHPH